MKVKLNIIHTIGFKLLIILLAIDYIPQAIFHFFIKEHISKVYTSSDLNSLVVFPSIIVFLLTIILLDNITPYIKLNTLKFKGIYLDAFMLTLSILFLISSLYFAKKYSIDFRHTHRLHETGLLVKLIPFLKAIAIVYILIVFSKYIKSLRLNKLQRLNILLILISFFLSLASSIEILFIGILSLFLLPKKSFIKLIFFPIKLNRLIFYLLFSFLLIVLAIYIGFANKFGIEETNELFSNIEGIIFVISHVLVRVSTYEETYLILFYNNFFDIDLQIYLWEHIPYVIKNRIATVIPIWNYDPQFITTINTVSYQLLFEPNIQRLGAGSTPGPLASMFFFPTPFLGLIIISMYTLIIIRIFNTLFYKTKLNYFGLIILTFFFARFLENPIGILYLLEPITIMFTFLLLTIIFFKLS